MHREPEKVINFLMGKYLIPDARLTFDLACYFGYTIDEFLELTPEKLLAEKPQPRLSIYSKELTKQFNKTVVANVKFFAGNNISYSYPHIQDIKRRLLTVHPSTFYDPNPIPIPLPGMNLNIHYMNLQGGKNLFDLQAFSYAVGQKLHTFCTLTPDRFPTPDLELPTKLTIVEASKNQVSSFIKINNLIENKMLL